MVAKPILELTSVSSLTGNEQFPVVQYGATKKASINDIAVPLSHFFPAIGVAITGVNSVETGGSLVSGVTIDLVNDTASPGALMLYGTDLAGTRGWQPQTAGGTVAVVDSGAGLTGGPITVSGSLSVATNGIADTMLRQSAALSVMGRSANSTGNVADIAATTSGHVLQVVGNALAFAPVTASGIGAVASVSGTANEITAIGVDVVTIGLSNTLYFGGKTVSGGTFYNMVVNNITVSGGTEQGVTYSGGTLWSPTVNNPTMSGGTWQGFTTSGGTLNAPTVNSPTVSGGTFQGITVSGGTFNNPTINNITISGSTFNNSTFNNPTVSGGNFSGPRLSNAVASGNWTTSGTWALPAVTLSGAVTATGQTITGGAFNGPAISGGTQTGPGISVASVGGNWTVSGTWALPAVTLSGAVTATGQTITNGSYNNPTVSGGTFVGGMFNGPTVSTTVGVGGATPAASGAGVSFPATQNASTDANTLDDYEEGTWTPADGSGAGLSLTVGSAQYVKTGQIVTCSYSIQYPVTANAAQARISGLPFTSQNTAQNVYGQPPAFTDFGSLLTLLINGNATTFDFYSLAGAAQLNSALSAKQFRGVLIYRSTS